MARANENANGQGSRDLNLTFIAFSRYYGAAGQVFVVFVMTVAAAEAAVGLAIIISIFRHRQSVNLQNINLLKG